MPVTTRKTSRSTQLPDRREPQSTNQGTISQTIFALADAGRELQACYNSLLASLNKPCTRAVEIEQALGINNKLAWQVQSVITAPHPAMASLNAPGVIAARTIIRSAHKHRVPASITSLLLSATECLGRVICQYVGRREHLELVVRSALGNGLGGMEADLKRNAFHANAAVTGRMCDVAISLLILSPGDEQGTFDAVSVLGYTGLMQFRELDSVFLGTSTITDTGDGLTRDSSLKLMADFCSQPTPPLHTASGPSGVTRYFTKLTDVGTVSAMTVLLSSVHRGLPIQDGELIHTNLTTTPAEVYLHDCLISPELAESQTPLVRVLEAGRQSNIWPTADADGVFPITEHAQLIGVGPAAASYPSLSWYTDMVGAAAAMANTDIDDFNLYRIKVDHPVHQCTVWTRYQLNAQH